jgi:protein-disulfide isomerase
MLHQLPPVVVLVFHMDGCPACEAFLPKFRAIAPHYGPLSENGYMAVTGRGVPSGIYDANKCDPLAEHFNIRATPTMIVARRQASQLREEGDLDERTIHLMFQSAQRQLQGWRY